MSRLCEQAQRRDAAEEAGSIGSQLYGVERPVPLDIHADAAHAQKIIGLKS
jgi:hypothetical protein